VVPRRVSLASRLQIPKAALVDDSGEEDADVFARYDILPIFKPCDPSFVYNLHPRKSVRLTWENKSVYTEFVPTFRNFVFYLGRMLTYELKRCVKFDAASYWLLSPRVLRGRGRIKSLLGTASSDPLARSGSYKTAKARLWPWLSGKIPQHLVSCSFFCC